MAKQDQIPKKLQSQFLLRLSNLLDEGYTFHSSLLMLLPYHVKCEHEVSRKIDETLRNGNGVVEIFILLGISVDYLLPIEMAESHGRLNVAIGTLQRHISMKERAKASLKKIMMYPLFLFIILGGLFIAFRTYFLPNMKTLVASRQSADQDEILNWTNTLLHVPDMLISITIGSFFIYYLFHQWLKRKSFDFQLKTLKKTPYFSSWMKIFWTRSFAQELGTLLASGISLLKALDLLRTQTNQPFIQAISMQIYQTISLGESVEKAVTIAGCFLKEFPAYISHGEASGHLAKELLIFSDLLTEQIENKVTKNLAFVQPILFGILAICILGAYLSILLPVYGMIDFI